MRISRSHRSGALVLSLVALLLAPSAAAKLDSWSIFALLKLGSGSSLQTATVNAIATGVPGVWSIALPYKAGDTTQIGTSFVSSGKLVVSDSTIAKLSIQSPLATVTALGSLRAQEFCFALNLQFISAQLASFANLKSWLFASLEIAPDGSMKVVVRALDPSSVLQLKVFQRFCW